jgi:excisionase family DNA binding protein
MKHIEPPENLPVAPEPPAPTEPETSETHEDVHFRDPRAGDMVDNVPVSGGKVRTDIPASRSLQPIRLTMLESKERPIRAPDDLLSVDDVAEKLLSSRTAIYRLVARGCLPVYRLPAGIRFKAADLNAYIESLRHEARHARPYGRPKNQR